MKAEYGRFTKSTGGTGNQTVTLSDSSLTPVAVIMWATHQTAAGFAARLAHTFGFSDGSTDRCWGGWSQDAVTTTETDSRHAAKVASLLDDPGGGKAVQWEGEIDSFSAGQFVVNWTTNDANAVIIHYVVIECADAFVGQLTSPGSTGDQVITGVGFQGDVVLVGGGGIGLDPPVNAIHGNWNLGMASDASHEFAMAVSDADALATSSAFRRQHGADQVMVRLGTGAGGKPSEAALASLVSLDPDGFTLNYSVASAGGARQHFLVLKGVTAEVGSAVSPTSTGTQAHVLDLAFKPKLVFFISHSFAINANVVAHKRISIFAADGTSAGGYWAGATDNVGTTVTDVLTRAGTIALTMAHLPGSPTADVDANLDSLDDDGFTLDFTNVEAVAREYGYLCLGDAVIGKPVIIDQAVNRAATY